jgi:hypothetical protein
MEPSGSILAPVAIGVPAAFVCASRRTVPAAA